MMVAAELKENIVPIRPIITPSQRRTVRSTYRPKIGKKAIIMTGLFFLLVITNLVVQAMIAQTQYRINMRQNQIDELERKINLVNFKLADLGSDKRIEQIAEEKLEMHPANSNEIAFVPIQQGEEGTLQSNSKRVHMALAIAQLDESHQPGIGQKFAEWIQGLGRTMAGTDPAELQ
jgi:cell division protein FtsL